MKILLLFLVLYLLNKPNVEGMIPAINMVAGDTIEDYNRNTRSAPIQERIDNMNYTNIRNQRNRRESSTETSSETNNTETNTNTDTNTDTNTETESEKDTNLVIIKYLLLIFFFLMFGVFVGYKLKDPK